MKKFLIAAAAVAALTGAAGAASAQTYGYGYGAPRYERGGQIPSVERRQEALRAEIERGAQTGRLTRSEVQILRRDIAGIDRLERQYRRDRGLNRQEVRNLHARLDNIEQRLDRDLRDGERYGYGYGNGYDPRYGYDRR